MSEWIPPGHRPHDGHPDDDVRWCECSGRCTQDAPCDCCELAELRAEVDSLRAGAQVAQAAAGKRIAEVTAELADRDRRIAEALAMHARGERCAARSVNEHSCSGWKCGACYGHWPCRTVKALRGES